MRACWSSVLEFSENTVTVVLVGVAVVVAIVSLLVEGVEVEQIVFEIDPGESLNMSVFDAFEWTQANPQSCWLKDVAPPNIQVKSVTFDTFHLDKSSLKDIARQNILCMLVTWDTSHLEMSESKFRFFPWELMQFTAARCAQKWPQACCCLPNFTTVLFCFSFCFCFFLEFSIICCELSIGVILLV